VSRELLPAATVVPIRDGASGLEVLLLRRVRVVGSDAPAPWVFPGGRIEPADGGRAADVVEQSARRAAVREAREEAGLEFAPASLVPISRWITPEIAPRRFDTWFYLIGVEGGVEVRVDGSEIAGHRWLEPHAALDAHHGGEIRLAPPTFVTVTWLAEHRAVSEALATLAAVEVLTFRPRVCRIEAGACILYPGDAGYEAGDPERPGPRHRLWALPGGYRYERGGA
jgi:8-oxo-dGTP pyrophosphatase MutT (NUDIX family)